MSAAPIVYFKSMSAADADPVPRPELFDEEAKQVARLLINFEPTQLRRFYAPICELRGEVKANQDFPDDLVRARLALLKAHVHYASGREKGKIPAEFLEYINSNVRSVKTRTDFLLGFAPYFEAVVAYHRFERSLRSR